MNKLKKLNMQWFQDLNVPENIKPAAKVLIYELSLPSESKLLQYTHVVDNGKRDTHGTYVGEVIKQILPDAELYASTGFLSPNIETTIDYCITHNIRIINVSATAIESDAGNLAINRFAKWGGIVCAAAGNTEGGRVSWPARSPYTIAVSATNTPDCNGPEIDVTVSSHWKVYQLSGALHDFDGTSAATPALAACVAIILGVHPEWKLEEVKAFLRANSVPGNEEFEKVFRFPDGFGKEEEAVSKEYIVLHHSAGADGITRDFEAMKKYHMEHNGWRDIGYHWVVERINGVLTAIPGRPESDTGAHCPGRNGDGIGVCLVGDFTYAPPDKEQYQFVANLCKDIMTRHPIKEIGGHRDYYATACPGAMFDVDKVKEAMKVEDIKGRWSEEDIKLVVAEGLMKGYPDGTFKPEQPVTREELAAVLARIIRKG